LNDEEGLKGLRLAQCKLVPFKQTLSLGQSCDVLSGGRTDNFLNKRTPLVNIKHKFSLKRPECLPDDYHRQEGFAIGMNLKIRSAGDIDWAVFVNAEIW
jgi:hypothetical protein